MNNNFFLLLQMNDSLFPIGGYTQSYGFETYIQKNIVTDGNTAEKYLMQQLSTSFLYSELLAIKFAYEYALNGDIQKLYELEQKSKASRSPKELREASLKIGNRFVKAIQSLDLNFDSEIFDDYCTKCKPIGISHSIVYGVLCAVAQIDKQEALASYLYAQTSSSVTTCVKLVPLSQTVGQQILYKLQLEFVNILDKLDGLDEDSLFISCPALDIRSMQHEILYSRLYMS